MRGSSFGGFGGSNMGEGRGGSVQILRSIQRIYQTGEGISRSPRNSTTTTTASGKYGDNKNKAGNSAVLTLSSCTSPRKTTASVVASTWPSCPSPTLSDESDWECIIGTENDTTPLCFDDIIFGRPPSTDEAQQAFYSLQGVLESGDSASSEYSIHNRHKINSDKGVAYQVSSPSGSLGGGSPFGTPDWEEPPRLCNSSTFSPCRIGQADAYEVLNLLQKDHDIQRIAESISTDKAVWDAVKNNEVVRELRRAYLQADVNSEEGSDGDSADSNGAIDILNWIVTKVKSKIMELIQNITRILDEFLHRPEGGNDAERNLNHFDRKVQVSLVVTFVVFLTVVLQRLKHASNPST